MFVEWEIIIVAFLIVISVCNIVSFYFLKMNPVSGNVSNI